VPRGSVTTTHHRLRPNQAQVLPPIKTKPKPILNRLTLKPTYSKRPPKQPKLQKHPAAHALSLSRTPQAHPPSPRPHPIGGASFTGGLPPTVLVGWLWAPRAPQRWGSTDPQPRWVVTGSQGLGPVEGEGGLEGMRHA